MSVADHIVHEALDLGMHETMRMVCPFCQAEHEQSLAVTRITDKLLYHCFRAACGASGAISSTGDILRKLSATKAPTEPYVPKTTHLTNEQRMHLLDKYNLTTDLLFHNRVSYDGFKKRMAIPITDQEGKQRGWYFKDEFCEGGHGYHKLCNIFESSPRLYFPATNSVATSTAVIVEDPLSAIALSPILPAISILGTHITDKEALVLGKFKNLYIWLDHDAIHKAVKIRDQYPTLNVSRIIITKQDPKNLPIADRWEALR